MENKVSKEIFNPVQDNIKKLAELFPTVVKDGQVDFEALKQELGQVEEVGKEKYELTWPGKTLAKQLALTDVVGKTLKYVPEESKNPDTTENLYIEGDNLEVLKLLRNSYYGKIKMIYIDPPYNTGNDFIYKDDFKKLKEESDKEEGELDENGERLIKNQRSSARFHSNWLNMMYPRLKVAKDLLSDDGVIFISIDDNEVANLRKICDEIFGEENFVGEIIRKTKSMTGDKNTGFNLQHESLVCYAKIIENVFLEGEEKDFDAYDNPDNDPNGDWVSADPSAKSGGPSLYFEIINPYTGKIDLPPKGRYWAFSKETLSEYIKNGKIVFKKRHSNNERGFIFKRYKNELKSYRNPVNSLDFVENSYMNQNGTKELRELMKGEFFPNPKPLNFIKKVIFYSTSKDSIILDFFSGSATTAHAVMQLNAEDGGKRKFIMVQLPEPCPEDSEAYKAGFKTIADIGKERIRRAGEKIKEEFKDKEWIDDLDIGFKVFKVAETNIRWNDEVFDGEQITLSESALSVKDALDFNPGFTDIDVVYEIMLRHRDFPLTSKIEKLTNIGNRTYMFADSVVVCLEETITSDIVDKIASLEPKPIKIIFRDSAFDDDISLKLNILHRLDTQIKLFNQGKDQTYRVEFI
ncbi:site-specific DNA-methyltransferase [Thermoanaerobacter siderophilus]|uniref:Adenine specific DNA methylase Mod n=1 Tax=Thermoanaerobacter siderophilus SR4 TaxID=880478 RepID=I8R0N9_9THEO|nr:site-specific DNA-methyltransferase [Thermoanaerobacter siderophilus]EIW01003.1 adenine specific DNA methylase Mod [Thermoanaerobacter siderophilus SR4]